jgi:hypothetical protein
VIFGNLLYGLPWTIPKTLLVVWSSLDISKNNYLISKPNYFIPFLISIFICANVEKKVMSTINSKYYVKISW